jgi:cellulose synthase/poly-beta-1,6-N-acetylglucosamine synthase-like glycosyltransferase
MFEYFFRYEYGIRTSLESPVLYLGSAAVWRRKAIDELGGWRTEPFTAEDVDLGYRAGSHGWKVLYERTVLAQCDAVENLLEFRIQQRRWARCLGQAWYDAIRGFSSGSYSNLACLIEYTTPLALATIPLTLLIPLLIAVETLIAVTSHPALCAIEWLFTCLLFFQPSLIAVVLAIRHFHPSDWIERVKLLARSGPAATATMTSFAFGVVDLITARHNEFISTPKGGQHGVVRGSPQRWLAMLRAPILFEACAAFLLFAGAITAGMKGALPAFIPTAMVGVGVGWDLAQSLAAARRYKTKLSLLARKTNP